MEEERQFKTSDKILLKGIWKYSKNYLGQIIITFVFLLILSGLQIVLPIVTKNTIDNYIQKSYLGLKVAPSSELLMVKHSGYAFRGDSIIFIPSHILSKDEYVGIEKDSILIKDRFYPVERIHQKMLIKNNLDYNETYKYLFVIDKNLASIPKEDLKIVRQKDLSGVKSFALIFLSLLIVSFFFNYFQVIIMAIASEKIMYDMRNNLMKHLMSLSMDFFHKNPIGRLVTRATNDVAALRDLFTDVFIYSAKDVLTLIGIVIIMFKLSPKLAVIVLSVVPFVVLLLFLFQKYARGAYRDVRTALAKVNAFLSEAITGVSLIQAFNQQRNSYDFFTDTGREYYKANMRQLFVFSIFRPLIDVMSYITLGIMIYFGGRGIMQGEFTIGILVAFIAYIEMFFRPIFDFSEKYNIYQAAMASSERIFLLLDEKSAIKEKDLSVKPHIKEGKIEFRNVTFEYKKGEPVLKNVSFTIEPNRSVAFVGATGAGKTTIINLLMRFYDPIEGEILIDGINIKDIPVESVREYFGLVMQDVMIFSGDVRYNIVLNREISNEKMIEYSKYVNAHKFVEKLDKLYETNINERGTNLSTGQRQLLAFARALCGEPKVLILDEATSNIDSETEFLIQDAIGKIMKSKTTIAIAHRLSTIQDADIIYVLNRGKIVEYGTHKELLANRKYYYDLYKLQYVK